MDYGMEYIVYFLQSLEKKKESTGSRTYIFQKNVFCYHFQLYFWCRGPVREGPYNIHIQIKKSILGLCHIKCTPGVYD